MVQNRLRDGKRIAQLLASELTGDQAALETVVVADADPDVEPTADGAFAYRVVHVADSDALTTDDRGRPTLAADVSSDSAAAVTEIATVSVQPEHAAVAFSAATERAVEAATATDLDTVSTTTNDTIRTGRVRLADGVDAKRVVPVFEAVVTALSPRE